MALTGNKGDWSEIYALFKIIGDKTLYAGNENIEKITNVFYPIIKILRTESNGSFEYLINQEIVIISSENKELLRISIKNFEEQAKLLLKEIKGNDGYFAIPEIEDFMNKVHCSSIKASSSAKTDITIVIHDTKTNQEPVLGFSIKSQLGNPSTLLNATIPTNFKYEIKNINLSEEQITEINAISTRSKIKDRIEKILELGGAFCFTATDEQIFYNNLILIDSLLPQIIAEVLFKYYSSKLSKTTDLVDYVENQNPLNFDNPNSHKFYSYKIKRFLTDIALGMMPAKVWTGEYDATGGYLVVKEDGDVLCYHIYNKNDFENYLINNTKLETGSSTRHKFGKLFLENGKLYFKLNLQIRFLK